MAGYKEVNKNSILFFLPASHFNDTEFTTVKNFLEKNRINVFIASDSSEVCQSDSNQKVRADINLYNIHETNFCGIVLIGGTGARQYWNNFLLHKIVASFHKAGKIVAAICSAPVILANAGILQGLAATCFDEDKDELIKSGCDYKDVPVFVSGNIVTAKCSKASLLLAESILQLIRNAN